MEFRLLGPVEVERDGRALPLGGPKQRAVLALLLLRHGKTVPVDVLIDEIWGEDAPPTARNALQGYVFQLRKVLEPGVRRGEPHTVLVSDGAGYRVGDVDVDVGRFEQLVADAKARRGNTPSQAAATLDEALALWRGPPLADLAFERFAQAEVNRLEELRLAAQEERFDAYLAAGRHQDVVGDVEALARGHPTRERLHCQLLLALYRCGRQADALEAYAYARQELVEGLGVEPGDELKRLHMAILNHDPALDAPAPRPPLPFRPPPRPATRLVGRQEAVEDVQALLREHRVVCLLGPGGIGKTRLAQAVIERVSESFPDGVGWIELETIRDPADVLLEVAAAAALDDPIEGLADCRALLVLDNLEQVIDCAGQLAELVARTAAVHLLVTSREPLDIASERRYEVPLLEPGDAFELFRERAGAVGTSIGGSEGAAAAICERLEGLPLALELAAAQTTVLPPAQLLEHLDSSDVLVGTRRDAPERHRSLRAAIEWSHELMDESSRLAYARLAVFAGGWTLAAGEAVAEVDARQLETLVAKSLVRRDGVRFSMLESIRQEARERLEASGEAEGLRAAHAQYVAGLVRRLDDERPEGWLLDLDAEHGNIRAAFDWALDAGAAELALELATAARTFWESRGYVDEGLRRLGAVLGMPEAADEPRARALYAAGVLQARRLRFSEAEELQRTSVELWRGVGDDQGLARSLNALGIALSHLGRLKEAEDALLESLQLKRNLADDRGAAIALLSLGNLAVEAGDATQAETYQREALDALRAAGDELGVATALDDLAVLRLLADDADGAEPFLRESLAVSRHLGSLSSAAWAMTHLALAQCRDPERTIPSLLEAIALFRSLGEEEGVAAALDALALIWISVDQRVAATLVGAANAVRAQVGVEPGPLERWVRERLVPRDEEAWAAAVADGVRCGLDVALQGVPKVRPRESAAAAEST